MTKYRWPLLTASLAAFFAVFLIVILGMPSPAHSQSPTATATGLNIPPITVNSPTPTATRERSGLASPTPTPTEVIPEPLQTLNAFNAQVNATIVNMPTPTLGPSAIKLDGQPHYIKFFADWCGPCRAMKPAVEKMKVKYGDEVTFWEINTDNVASVELLIKHRVEFIPLTVLLDKDGKVFMRLEGFQTEAELDAAIRALLANHK